MLDPNLDSNCTGGIIGQPGAGDLCIVHYGTIDIASDATITIVGSTAIGRAIVFVADTDLSIEGTLDVGGHPGMNGPGGGTVTSGASPGIDEADSKLFVVAALQGRPPVVQVGNPGSAPHRTPATPARPRTAASSAQTPGR